MSEIDIEQLATASNAGAEVLDVRETDVCAAGNLWIRSGCSAERG